MGCSSEGAPREVGGTAGGGGSAGGGAHAGNGGGIEVPLPEGTDPASLLPARIRRLTNAEYDASAIALTGTTKLLARDFAPDARQDGFTVNDAQRVDPVVARQIAGAAETLAAEVRGKLDQFAPCATPAEPETCAAAFIDAFGARVYRRPLATEEKDGLLTVYRTGAEGAAYADGVELVVRALLQSAGFLYLTEIGSAPSSGVTALTPYELASSLSYLITAAPPDDALVASALAGGLATPEGREAAAWTLLSKASARDRVVRMVTEWLGVDRIDQTAKDVTVYPQFDELKAAMQEESVEFITSVLRDSSRTVGEILSADWSVVPPGPLVAFYGATAQSGTAVPNRVSFGQRRGVLNQAAFLSVYAHAHESAPVLRGVAVARRIACVSIPSPTSLNIVVVAPASDPTKTTRERFVQHVADPECSSCHRKIDPFGFSFEQFDGMGRLRALDNNKPVDSQVTVAAGTDVDGAYADSNALAAALAASPAVRACFARHLFRAAAGRSDSSSSASEEAFLRAWAALGDKQGDVVETLVAFVKSPLFGHRRAQ